MAKTLKVVGTAIVFAGVVLATGGAALIPAVAGGGIFGAFGTAAFGLTASQWIGLGSLVSSIGTAMDKPASTSGGNPTDWSADPNAAPHFIAGRIGVAGNIVRMKTFGPDDMYQGIVTVFSAGGPVHEFEGYSGDDQPVTFDGNGKAITSQWKDEMWRKISLGEQPALALTSPIGLKNGAVMPGWGPEHKLSGKAASMLVLGENSKFTAYPTGIPKQIEVIKGLYGWDPRLDDTYPGGSGPCRLNDPSTWVYLKNPILWALKWCLGIWEGPNGRGAPFVDTQVGGIGASLDAIDVPAFVAAANVSDSHNWTVCAWPSSDDDEAQVLADFLQAGGAVRSYKAGKISCVSRATPRPSVVTISVADTAGDVELDAAQTRINRINAITPSFRSEEARWEITSGTEVTAEAYQAADGGKRPRGVTYTFVSDYTQSAQLAALDIAHAREGISGVLPMKPYMQDLEPGEAFTIIEEGFLLNGLKCLCLNNEYDPQNDICRVTFISETDTKYPFAFGQSPDAPVIPSLQPVDSTYVRPPLPGEWNIVVRPPNTGGGTVPGFDLTGIVSNANAYRVLVEYALDDEGPWMPAYDGPPTSERIEIFVQPNTLYYIGITYFNRAGNSSQRIVYGPFLSGELVSDTTVRVGGLTAEELFDLLEELTALGEALGEDAAARIREIIASIADGDQLGEAILNMARELTDLQTWMNKHGYVDGLPVGPTIKSEIVAREEGDAQIIESVDILGVRVGDTEAALIEEATLRADGDSAEAVARALLAVRVTDNEAAIAEEQTARADADSAEAAARLALTARVTDAEAAIVNEASVRADAISAEATQRNLLAVALGNLEGSFVNEQSVRIANDGIFTTNFTLQGGRNLAQTAWIFNENTTEIGSRGTFGSVFNALIAADGANSAAITNEASVRAGADGTFASQISSLSVTTGGNTASITTLFSVSNGLAARAALSINVNNRVTGYEINGATSSIIFATENFAVASAGSSGVAYYPFVISGGKINFTGDVRIDGNLFVDGTITTNKIMADNITIVDSASLGFALSGNGTQQTAVSYNIFLPYAAKVVAIASARHSYATSSPRAWYMNILANGGQIAGAAGQGFGTDSICASGYTSLGPGWHTLEIVWQAANSEVTLASANLVIMAVFK